METTEPDWIKEELDKVDYLNSLRGDEFADEAKRLGFVITDKGLFADPNHAAREHFSLDEAQQLLEARARRHGHVLDLDPADHGPEIAAS